MQHRRKMAAAQPYHQGFTLIEVLVTVVIVAILTAVAMPIYSNYVLRGKIPDATSNLATKRMAMEQFFQDNHTYVGADAAGFACASDTTTSQYYDFSCGNALTATTYTIVATGKGQMKGFGYSIDQSAIKTSSVVAPAPTQWIAAKGNCWINNAGGSC